MIKMDWIAASILALILFGTWGAIIKYATGKIDVVPLMLFNTLSSLIIVAGIFGWMWISKNPVAISREGIYIALLAGVVAILAVIFEAVALKAGNISTIVPIISVGGLAISVAAGILFFNEALTARLVLGIVFSFAAIYLLSAA